MLWLEMNPSKLAGGILKLQINLSVWASFHFDNNTKKQNYSELNVICIKYLYCLMMLLFSVWRFRIHYSGQKNKMNNASILKYLPRGENAQQYSHFSGQSELFSHRKLQGEPECTGGWELRCLSCILSTLTEILRLHIRSWAPPEFAPVHRTSKRSKNNPHHRQKI